LEDCSQQNFSRASEPHPFRTRNHLNATNAAEIKGKQKKINEPDRYPAAIGKLMLGL